MLQLRWPSLEQVFTDHALDRLADVWAPILERHNFDMGRAMIYLNAAIATAPVLGEGWKAVRHDRALEAAAAPAAPPGGVVNHDELAARAQAAAASKIAAAPSSSSTTPAAPPDTSRLSAKA